MDTLLSNTLQTPKYRKTGKFCGISKCQTQNLQQIICLSRPRSLIKIIVNARTRCSKNGHFSFFLFSVCNFLSSKPTHQAEKKNHIVQLDRIAYPYNASRLMQVESLVSNHSACLCKNYLPKCSQIPHELDYLNRFFSSSEPTH